jgi:polyether ionophore transport system permease protein
MLRNIFLKTLRDNRWGTLIWGLGIGALLGIVVTEYVTFVGRPESLAAFTQAYQAFGFLVGEYVPIDTLGGFLTIEAGVYTADFLAIWLAVMGVGVIRGEEEPGTLDALLATPHGRGTVFWQKVAAVGVCLVLANILIAAGLAVSLWATGQRLPFDGVLGALLNGAILAAFWGAAGVLLGQLIARRRTATILAGGLVVATFLVNNIVETVPVLRGWGVLLPFHYYNLSKPLVPGRTLDPGAVAVLTLATAGLLILAAWLFARRDVGAAFALWPARARARRAPRAGSLLLGSVWAKSLRDQVGPTLGGGLALTIYCALMVGTVNSALAPMYEGLNAIPWFTKLFGPLVTNEGYISVVLFFYFPAVIALLMLLNIWGWAGEEEEGRLEVLIAAPVARSQVVLARYGAALLSLAGILALTFAGIALTAAAAQVPLRLDRVAEAVLGAAPPALVVLAFGLALATWLPRPGMAVGVTGGLLIAMFLLDGLAPLFDWPDVVRHLSIFHYYGRPMLDGLVWGDMAVLLIAAGLLVGWNLLSFRRRDILT